MSKEKRRVPKLRFPGFTEDWEQRKLTDIAKTFIGLVTTMTENYRDSGTLLIRNSDIKEGQFIFSEKPIHLDEEFAEKNKTRRLQIGDVVTVHTGDIGTSAVIKEKEAGAIGFATINTRTDKRILNPYFLSTYFNTEKHKCYANSVSTGDGRSNYNIKDFNKLVISIPTLDEQEKISAIINNINTIITLHQRKLEHLNLKKKALLQKLFPKNGERYPELRFPGFTDDWEQRKLGDFTNQINTFVNPEDAKLPLWSLTAESGLIEKSDRYERDFLVKKKDQFKRIETNTLVYNPMNITIGSIDIYTGLYPIAVSGYYVSIVYDKNIDTDFLKEALLLPSSLKMYKNYATGSLIERQRVQYPTFSKLQLLFPNLDEQKAIGQLFKSLNLNITLHQRKLEHLQLQKKALLQQMFV